jgi:hypothetical protein
VVLAFICWRLIALKRFAAQDVPVEVSVEATASLAAN